MLSSELIRYLTARILATLFIVVSIIGCGKGDAPVTSNKLPELKVGYIPIADAAQLYVAKDRCGN